MAIKWNEDRNTYHDYGNDYTSIGRYTPQRLRPTYEGCVLAEKCEVERVMSDVWEYVTRAQVWDAAKGVVTSVVVGTSNLGGQDGTIEVDATDEVRAAVAAWEAKLQAERDEHERVARAVRLEEERKRPDRGKTLKVVRGRKVPKGTEGRCFWIGPDKFGNGDRVGIETAEGKVHWTAARNCEAVGEAA